MLDPTRLPQIRYTTSDAEQKGENPNTHRPPRLPSSSPPARCRSPKQAFLPHLRKRKQPEVRQLLPMLKPAPASPPPQKESSS